MILTVLSAKVLKDIINTIKEIGIGIGIKEVCKN